ncbi:hypothetical protein DFH08DRAFT_774722 [Mycena albidolilacea]|uniref:Uncharacterized protein n=1 Tax=Mycena albidolilacea TaxID=1033008 RepID=A0AAD7EXX7_9AGAR|nr:hypothetical protein DFH08DRAFT_774722 [Mycena albidolilacea]
MPGPRNSKKKGKGGNKRSKPRLSIESTSSGSTDSQHLRTPSPILSLETPKVADDSENAVFETGESCPDDSEGLPQKPFIHDPGNGHRVRDMRAFLSSFFAQPAALDDPLCAEFSQDEVLQMICTVLPEETALILWYNKSRSMSRICPACQRLYRLGDVLPGHTDFSEEHERSVDQRPPPQLKREQEISGLCSAVCFILASYNYPAAITSAWGHTADDIDDEAWGLLNSVGAGNAISSVSVALGMLVRMTRLHDLGLAQLCLPDVDFDAEGYSDAEDDTFRGRAPIRA